MDTGNHRAAFTLAEVMIAVAIIGLLAAIAIPNFIKARRISQKSTCIANLKQLDGAISSWALEQGKTGSDTPADTDLFGPSLYIKVKPGCPAAGRYEYQPVGAADGPVYCTLKGTDFHTLPGQ